MKALSEQKPAILLDGFNLQTSGPPVKGVQRMAVQLNLLFLRARKMKRYALGVLGVLNLVLVVGLAAAWFNPDGSLRTCIGLRLTL